MYARKLDIYGFKAFGKASLSLRHPSMSGRSRLRLPNVNLVLGDNGGGKSSVLRALAIAVLAPALLESGFVPYRLVRRGRPDERAYDHALIKVAAVPGSGELRDTPPKLELLARIDRRDAGPLDRLHLDRTPASPVVDLIHDDRSPAFFVVGYGATRRVETGEFSAGSAQRSRGLRYRRVAGLFEDHVALRPLQAWLPRLAQRQGRFDEAIRLLNAVLPDTTRFDGALDPDEDQYLFDHEGVRTPLSAMSDGYKAFIGWVGDLIGHLADVTPPGSALVATSGIVLVDEIDLHLHPAWQRSVVPTLAHAFPKLQFVLTSHSPLVASTVERENVFVTDVAEDGVATVKQIEEKVYGRSAEQLLLSSYFGLETTRPDSFQDEARGLFRKAAAGDSEAALAYLESIAPAGADEAGKA